MNKCILIGNLGNTPETRYTASGTAVTNFRMATNKVWNDANGERQKQTQWHRIVVWGKLAEVCAQYLTKGRQVMVEGEVTYSQWEDKNGNTRYNTEIKA